jgi:5-methylcytosine-specific restriction endonuclease McrA
MFTVGYTPTEEHRRKLSESHKGIRYPDRKRLSLEDKKKLSDAHKGNKSALGKTWTISEEKKAKINYKGNHRGHIHSEETRKRISKNRKGKAMGEKNGVWKGGCSKYYRMGYYTPAYKQWRKSVFERDNFSCRECGMKDVYLTAHHVKSFAYHPGLRYDLDNGLTLCEPCHSKTDNYKGRAKRRLNINP